MQEPVKGRRGQRQVGEEDARRDTAAADGCAWRETEQTAARPLTGLALNPAQGPLKRAEAAALSGPPPAELTDDELDQDLFARAGGRGRGGGRNLTGPGLRRSGSGLGSPDAALGGVPGGRAGRLV